LFSTKPEGQLQAVLEQMQFRRVELQTHPVVQLQETELAFVPVLPGRLLQLVQADLLAEGTEKASQMQDLVLVSQTIPVRQKQENGVALDPFE
jgi:hypothetical protein